MTRHDEALREAARARLHTVTGGSPDADGVPARVAATVASAPVATGRGGTGGRDPLGWLPGGPDDSPQRRDPRRARHRGPGTAPGRAGGPPAGHVDRRGPQRVTGHVDPDDEHAEPEHADRGKSEPGEPSTPAWVPTTPATARPVPSADVDARDVVTRMRAEALASAATAYADTYGHPIQHARAVRERPPLRWGLTVRHAVVAGAAVAVLATGAVVRAASTVPDEPSPVTAVAAPAGGSGDARTTDPQAVSSGAGAGVGPGAAGSGPAGSGAAAPGGAPAGTGERAPVVVHVVGQVAAPGVVELPEGSRVADALAAAGGATASADLSTVNLARVVADGEQIAVPAPGEAPAAAGAHGGGSTGGGSTVDGGPGPADDPVDLNTADLGELDTLPGIGPVLAQRIVDWRADNGPFRDVAELGEVSGIGEALLERLRPLVRV